jgi:hypothetical protein
MTWLWWAPFGATVLHIIEEFVYPGGFAEWDRHFRPAIRNSITPRLHIIVNGALLLLCVQVGILAGTNDAQARTIGIALWLAVAALLFSNAIFHVVGTIRTRTRSPGIVTAVALYMPMAVAGYWKFLSSGEASWGIAIVAGFVGGSYHLWAELIHRVRARGKDA